MASKVQYRKGKKGSWNDLKGTQHLKHFAARDVAWAKQRKGFQVRIVDTKTNRVIEPNALLRIFRPYK